jgi:hypothetical protein
MDHPAEKRLDAKRTKNTKKMEKKKRFTSNIELDKIVFIIGPEKGQNFVSLLLQMGNVHLEGRNVFFQRIRNSHFHSFVSFQARGRKTFHLSREVRLTMGRKRKKGKNEKKKGAKKATPTQTLFLFLSLSSHLISPAISFWKDTSGGCEGKRKKKIVFDRGNSAKQGGITYSKHIVHLKTTTPQGSEIFPESRFWFPFPKKSFSSHGALSFAIADHSRPQVVP